MANNKINKKREVNNSIPKEISSNNKDKRLINDIDRQKKVKLAKAREDFLIAYNQLDTYLKRLANLKEDGRDGGFGLYIKTFEKSSTRSMELNDIRELKNKSFSHRTSKILKDFNFPIALKEIKDEYKYIKNNESEIEKKLLQTKKNY